MILSQHSKDLLSTLLLQVWRLISGPITMILIPLFLTEVEQGYWYLFGSISALLVFADLGFTNIILQFSAHEFAFLSINSKGVLKGDIDHLKKIGCFFRFTLKWIITICLIIFPIIYIVGIWFFLRDKVFLTYIIPWTIFSIGSLLSFFNNSILSYVEGMNQIEAVQKIRFKAAVVNTLVIAGILLLNGNIYALAVGLFVSSMVYFLSIFGRFRKVLSQVLKLSKHHAYSWRKEVLPLFSRYALSFASGYFIFQTYIPLMQYFHGPVQSGKVGITLALVTSIFSISNIWIYTITPKMNILVSQKNKSVLDALFKRRLVFAAITYVGITLCLFLFLFIFSTIPIVAKIISRFLPIQALLMLLGCYFFQLIINSLATYLRAHKKEPYMVPSLILAVWIFLTTIYIGHNFKPAYFFIGFISSYIWWLPVAYIIYKRCQKNWYGE